MGTISLLERADEPHPDVSSDIIYTDNIYRSRGEEIFLIMIPPVNAATFQMFINYRHADTNIQS